MIKKYILFLLVCLGCVATSSAQHNTSSPYTRYGYGTILDGGFGQARAMGGISYGLRPSQYINPNNPASYTSIDSLTFRMEAGVSVQFTRMDATDTKEVASNGNLEFLAFQFPIKKWVALSFGLMPYSIVGYDYHRREVQNSAISSDTLATTYQYAGSGGITQLYAGLAFRPVKWLSFGGNFQFNFGNIEHSSRTEFDEDSYYSTRMTRLIRIKDVCGNFGIQAEIPMKEKHKLSVGGVFQMKSELNSEATQTIITTDSIVLNFDNKFDTPMYFGLGFVYSYLEEFLFGFDYKREMWSDVRFFGESPFVNRNKISFGGQYIPDVNGRSYFQRVAYRLGANFTSSYYMVNGEQLRSFSLTTGWGFPLKKGLNPTVMNVSFEYGHNGKIENNLIREQFFKFTLNATINERWFMKRKLN